MEAVTRQDHVLLKADISCLMDREAAGGELVTKADMRNNHCSED